MVQDGLKCNSVTYLAVLEMNRKDYAFRRQFDEKPSIIPGFSGLVMLDMFLACMMGEHACA